MWARTPWTRAFSTATRRAPRPPGRARARPAPRRGRHVGPERHRPDRPVAGHQRHDDRRPQAGGPEPLERRVVARPPAQQLVVDVGAAAAGGRRGGRRRARRRRRGRTPRARRRRGRRAAGRRRSPRRCRRPRSSGTSTQHQSASSGTIAAGGALERRVDVERRRQDLAGGGEEALVVLGPARVGHVLHDVHGHDDRALVVAHGRRLDEHPALVAGGLADAAHEHRLRRVARPAPRVPAAGRSPSVAPPRRARRSGRGSAAIGVARTSSGDAHSEQPRGRLVDVDQPVVRRLDRDRLGQVPEDRLELALGRAAARRTGARCRARPMRGGRARPPGAGPARRTARRPWRRTKAKTPSVRPRATSGTAIPLA